MAVPTVFMNATIGPPMHPGVITALSPEIGYPFFCIFLRSQRRCDDRGSPCRVATVDLETQKKNNVNRPFTAPGDRRPPVDANIVSLECNNLSRCQGEAISGGQRYFGRATLFREGDAISGGRGSRRAGIAESSDHPAGSRITPSVNSAGTRRERLRRQGRSSGRAENLVPNSNPSFRQATEWLTPAAFFP